MKNRFSKVKIAFYALLACLFVVMLGNLAGFKQLMLILPPLDKKNSLPIVSIFATLSKILSGTAQLSEYNYWDPTRVIPGTINEFPFFSFLFADLHPHMIAIPFTLLVLALIANFFLAPKPSSSSQSTEEVNHILPSVSLEGLHLSTRVYAALIKANITSLATLLRYSSEGLLKLPGIGEKSLEAIKNSLTVHNLTLNTTVEQPSSMIIRTFLHDFIKNRWLRILVLSFTTGALFVINSWDFPVYLFLIFLLLLFDNGLFNALENSSSSATSNQSLITVLEQFFTKNRLQSFGKIFFISLFETIVITILAYLCYLPFHTAFQNPSQGIGINTKFSTTGDFLLIFGFYIFILISFLAFHLRKIFKKIKTPFNALDWIIIFVLLGIVLFKFWSLPLGLFILLVFNSIVLFSERSNKTKVFALLLSTVVLCITFGTEILYIKDHLAGGDHRRMNTIFKFYNQAWILFGISSATMLYCLAKDKQLVQLSRITTASLVRRWFFTVGLLLLFGASCVYPIFATPVRINDRFPQGPYPPPTLDSLAFMKTGIYDWEGPIELSYELEAIEWLNENLVGNPPLLEIGGAIGFYREMGGRVASLTGLPTLSGTHENEQRDTASRGQDTKTIYETTDWEKAKKLMDTYAIMYIYLGQIERNAVKNTPEGLAKFDLYIGTDLELVFENAKVKIYKIIYR